MPFYSFSGGLPVFIPPETYSTLDDLEDVEITDPEQGQVIAYNAFDGEWENVDNDPVMGTLGDLSDVVVTSLIKNEMVVRYYGATGKWYADLSRYRGNLQDLTDVTIVDATPEDIIVYNSSTAQWENQQRVYRLNDLLDVDAPVPQKYQLLQYDGTIWKNQTMDALDGDVIGLAVVATGGDLNDLTDVTITTPSEGEVLYLTAGGQWVNSLFSIGELNDADDVRILGPQSGEILAYDGVYWTNQVAALPTSLAGVGNVTITSPQNNNVLQYEDGVWVNANAVINSFPLGDLTDVSVADARQYDILVYNQGIWGPRRPVLTITDLTDVDIVSTLVVGDILVWGSSSWENTAPLTTVEQLTDVTITNLLLGQTLKYDGKPGSPTNGQWVNVSLFDNLNDSVNDVNAPIAVDGQALTYNSTTEQWRPRPRPVVRLSQDFIDVDLVGQITTGDVLTYSSASWVDEPPPSYTLAGLLAVSIDDATSGQIIVYDGNRWVPQSQQTYALSDLVTLSNVQNGQALIYNGAVWVNQDLPEYALTDLGGVTVTTPIAGQAIRLNASTWVNVDLITNIGDINDVVLTGVTNGQVLIYNGAVWVNADYPGGSLASLSDVSFTSIQTTDFLYYNGTLWTNHTITTFSMENVNDVEVSSLKNNQILVWNGTNWQNENLVDSLNDLSNVVIATPTNGDMLQYNGTVWENAAPVPVSLETLNDTTITNPQNYDLLVYDGLVWENSTSQLALGQLFDVTLTNVVDNNVLEYNGAVWVNSTPATTLNAMTDTDITNPISGELLLYNSSSNKWVNQVRPGGTVEGIENVIIDTPLDGQLLRYFSDAWYNANQPQYNLDQLSDVELQPGQDVSEILGYDGVEWSNVPQPTFSLNELTGVNTSGVSVDDLLLYNSTTTLWEAGIPSYTLSDITDVSLTSPVSTNELKYNGSVWVNSSYVPRVLGESTDVTITSVTAGEVLQWDGTKWVNVDLSTFLSSLSDVSDSAADGTLLWDGTEWIGSSTPMSLGNVANCLLTNPAFNDMLMWDGSNWINKYPYGSLGELDDVTVTNAQSKQRLVYSVGTTLWSNQNSNFTLGSVGNVTITAATNGDLLRYDGATWKNTTSLYLLQELTDTTGIYTGMPNKSTFQWNNTNKWIGGEPIGDLNDLSNVVITSPSDRNVLIWNDSIQTWVNQTIQLSLNDLSNVTITSPAYGDMVQYKATSGQWENTPGLLDIGNLTDVFITGLRDNEILVYFGSNVWKNKGSGVLLQDLGEVVITNPSSGDQLLYSAADSAWINMAGPSLAGLSDVSLSTPLVTNSDLAYNGTEWVDIQSKTSDLGDIETVSPENNTRLQYDSRKTAYTSTLKLPQWTDSTFKNYRGTAGPFVRSSTKNNQIMYKIDGTRLTVNYRYYQTGGSGSIQGALLLELPDGLEMDSTYHTYQTFVTQTPADAQERAEVFASSVGSFVFIDKNGQTSASAVTVPYFPSKLSMFGGTYAANSLVWQYGYMSGNLYQPRRRFGMTVQATVIVTPESARQLQEKTPTKVTAPSTVPFDNSKFYNIDSPNNELIFQTGLSVGDSYTERIDWTNAPAGRWRFRASVPGTGQESAYFSWNIHGSTNISDSEYTITFNGDDPDTPRITDAYTWVGSPMELRTFYVTMEKTTASTTRFYVQSTRYPGSAIWFDKTYVDDTSHALEDVTSIRIASVSAAEGWVLFNKNN